MASRPFGSVLCDLEKLPDHSASSNGGGGHGGSGIPNSSTVTSTLSSGDPSCSSAGRTRSSSSVTGGGMYKSKHYWFIFGSLEGALLARMGFEPTSFHVY